MSEHNACQDDENSSDSDYQPRDSDSDCTLSVDSLELPPPGVNTTIGKAEQPIVLTSQSDLTHLTGQKHSA